MKQRRLWQFILAVVLPAFCSIAAGFFLFRSNALNQAGTGFQFISLGTIGGIVYASFRFLSKLPALAITLVLLILDEALLHSSHWSFVWEDTLYFIVLSAVLLLSATYFVERLKGVLLARLLIIASLMGIGYAIVAIILYIAVRFIPSVPGFNLTQMIYYDSAQGFLLGSALGLGVELSEYVQTISGGRERD